MDRLSLRRDLCGTGELLLLDLTACVSILCLPMTDSVCNWRAGMAPPCHQRMYNHCQANLETNLRQIKQAFHGKGLPCVSCSLQVGGLTGLAGQAGNNLSLHT